MEDALYNPNPLRILSYLSLHRNEKLIYGSKIAQALKINQGSTSRILRQFEALGIVQPETAGRTVFFRVRYDHEMLKAFRAFENLQRLSSLVVQLAPLTKTIILFGSCATGTDDQYSDIDLFIVAENDQPVRSMLRNYKSDREIKPVIVDSLELIRMEDEDAVFLGEIRKGKTLWEAEHDKNR